MAGKLHTFRASIPVTSLALVAALLLAAPKVAIGGPAQPSRAGSSPVCLAPTSFAELAAAARAAVVAIRPAADTGMLEDVLEEWLEEEWGEGDPTKREEMREKLARALRQRSFGSGVIVDPSGVVVTSARIVRFLVQVQAVMADGTRPKFMIVGVDDRSDIAVLELEPGAPRTRIFPSQTPTRSARETGSSPSVRLSVSTFLSSPASSARRYENSRARQAYCSRPMPRRASATLAGPSSTSRERSSG